MAYREYSEPEVRWNMSTAPSFLSELISFLYSTVVLVLAGSRPPKHASQRKFAELYGTTQDSHIICVTMEAKKIVGKSSNDDAIMNVDLPQGLSRPTCIHPSWRGWQATQSVQMRERQSHTMLEVERRDLHVVS